MALLAGTARLDITPRTPQHLEGYPPTDRFHESVHHPLNVRALSLQGTGGSALLATLDLLFADEALLDRARAILQAELDLPPECVWIAATHTHAAPANGEIGSDPAYLGLVEAQLVAAAALAHTRLEPVELTLARHTCEIGVNRREKLPTGEVILGNNPHGFKDRELLVLALHTSKGRRVASLANFACHGTVLGDYNKVLSGDWPGSAAHLIEVQEPGSIFFFISGGSANINPRERGDYATPELADQVGAAFVSAYREACHKLAPLPVDDTVSGLVQTIKLPRKSATGEPNILQRLHGLRIGTVRLAGFPGEVFSETSAAVKQAAPHPASMVASYVCGRSGGYVPVAEAYADGGYEVAVSPYSALAEGILRAELLNLLARL